MFVPCRIELERERGAWSTDTVTPSRALTPQGFHLLLLILQQAVGKDQDPQELCHAMPRSAAAADLFSIALRCYNEGVPGESKPSQVLPWWLQWQPPRAPAGGKDFPRHLLPCPSPRLTEMQAGELAWDEVLGVSPREV